LYVLKQPRLPAATQVCPHLFKRGKRERGNTWANMNLWVGFANDQSTTL